MIFAYVSHGILTSHKVESGKTIDGKYYEEYIKKTLRQATRKKRPEILAAGPIILHDNATPHGANGVTSLLGRYEWETLDHPPYSLDISPCDFDLFTKLKEDFELRFYGPVNPMLSCRARSVYLTISLLGRLCLLSG